MKKNITKILFTISYAVLCSSCANTYVHNTVKAPIFADSTKAVLSASVGMRHLELNLAYKTPKNMFLICNTYFGTKQIDTLRSFNKDRQLFADAGLGFVKKSKGKTYLGTYVTIGAGSSKLYIMDGQSVFFSTYIGNKSTAHYYRLAMTNYLKVDGKKARFQLALRTSLVKFPNQNRFVKYYVESGGFFGKSNVNYTGPYLQDGYMDLLTELNIGYDIKISPRLVFFIQTNIAVPFKLGDKIANTPYTQSVNHGYGYHYVKLNQYNYLTNKLGFEFYFR